MAASSSSSSSSSSSISKKKRGRPQDDVWSHYIQGERDKEGHASSTCIYCNENCSRGDITMMQGHLANHCQEAPGPVIRKYQSFFEGKQTKTKKRCLSQTSLKDFHDVIEELPQGKIDRINRALIKLFVCCGISFRIVESPFFVDFVQELNASYDPPSREVLANRLFESELGYVNSKITKELDSSDNLTLGSKMK
jgi:hypothetical protein